MKSVACHTASCRRSVLYAAGPDNSKVVARDYLHCCEKDAAGRDAWAQLDATREMYGANKPRMRVRKDADGKPILDEEGNPVRYDSTIYYEHFILSPDPRDRPTLEQVRAVATEWAAGEFPSFEVVIGYHRDTGIPHAHVIVNGVSMDGQTRIHDITRESGWAKGAWRRMQEIARAHGLSGFTDAVGARSKEGRPVKDSGGFVDDRAEKAMTARGAYSWLADLRARADCAARISVDIEAFKAALASLGVKVVAASRGDWKYVMADAPTHQATGHRLGGQWTEFGVGRRLARERAAGSWKPQGEARENLLAALSSLVAGGAQEVRAVGRIVRVDDPAERLERLHEIAEALAWAQAVGVDSLAELDMAASIGGPRAEAMVLVLRELECLPGEPPGRRPAKPQRSGWRSDSLHGRRDCGTGLGDIDDAALWDEVDEVEELGNGQGRAM